MDRGTPDDDLDSVTKARNAEADRVDAARVAEDRRVEASRSAEDVRVTESRTAEEERVTQTRSIEAERIAAVVDSRATAIAGLQAVADTQNQNIELLTASVNALAKAIEHRPTRKETINLVSVGQLVTLLMMIAVVFIVRDGQHQIEDCVTEGGECAQRNAAKTGEAVQSLNFTAIYTAICVQEGTPPEDMESCVIEKLTVRLEEERAKLAD